jgi:hypothetical protein
MFGTNKKSDGSDISTEGKTPVLVGERVLGNVFTGARWYNEDHKSFVIEFKQTNGATFTHRFNRPNKDSVAFEKSVDFLNTQMLHIATKVMTEQEYLTAVSLPSDIGDDVYVKFEAFVNKLFTNVFSKMMNKVYNLKITYRFETGEDGKIYSLPQLPLFPSFIEKGDTTESLFSTNPTYDFYERKTISKEVPSTEIPSIGAEAPGADIF